MVLWAEWAWLGSCHLGASGGHGQIVPEAGDAWGSGRLHIQDGVFLHMADPCPGVPGTAVDQPSMSAFLPSAPQCG